MIYRILKKSAKADVKQKAFFSGFGSIMNISPVTFCTNKDQSQDMDLLVKDMQKIGGDFRAAMKKVPDDD